MEIYSSYGHPRHSSMLVLLLIKITTYQSGAVCLCLQSLPVLPVWGQFLISSGKLPGCEPTTMSEETFDGNCARNQNRSKIFTDSHLQEARKQACKPLFSMRWDKWQKGFAKWVSGMTTHISRDQPIVPEFLTLSVLSLSLQLGFQPQFPCFRPRDPMGLNTPQWIQTT